MSRPRLLIVKTGTAVESVRRRFGDFESWFQRSLGSDRFDYDISAVHEGDRLPSTDALDAFSGVVVTGSPAMVTHRHDWSERTGVWLAEVVRTSMPVLGVCYGHQLIAHALGGRVAANPHGRRMGTRELVRSPQSDPLVQNLAECEPVHTTHVEVVLDLPPGARVIGRADEDPCHAIHFGGRTWGVQFHPEFDVDIMAAYVEARRDLLEAEGFDSGQIIERIRPSPAGDRVMQQFSDLCAKRQEIVDAVGE